MKIDENSQPTLNKCSQIAKRGVKVAQNGVNKEE